MPRIAFDMSSVMWTCLSAGVDVEGQKVEFEGRRVQVNTAAYGYENAVNHMVGMLNVFGRTPKDAILVFEGMNSKSRRMLISGQYKAGRGNRPPEAYQAFDSLRTQLKSTFRGLGACALTQDNAEGDDVLAWLAQNTKEDLVIVSYDNDLSVLNGKNSHGATVQVCIKGVTGENKYGDWPCEYITVYKAMVGDSSDSISGIKGFGPAAWEKFLAEFKVPGLREMARLGKLGTLMDLYGEAEQSKSVEQIVRGEHEFLTSWKLAKLYPEWVDTFADPIKWEPGLVKGRVQDERLAHWSEQTRLVTSKNYEKAYNFFQAKIDETEFFSVDLETSVDDASEEWLESRSNGKGVDVIGSKITGGSINFGANGQYAYYMTVDHVDSDNISIEQFANMLKLVPTDKITVAHNAAGFELPVMYNEFGGTWLDNGWRGFFPNMVDSRIAATFWDENADSHGLKQLSKKLFNYEQESYESVTGGLRMNQITAERVTSYGCDDVYVSWSLWNFFKLFMQLEHTLEPFVEFEQKPMYLQALSYCQGIRMDVPKLAELSQKDAEAAAGLQATLDAYLISKGWDGAVLPVVEELTPATIKQAVELCGSKIETAVRKFDKLSTAIRELEFDGNQLLANIVATNDVASFNKFVASRWVARPSLNTGSPVQLQKLLYETMGAPIRLRNKPTAIMRSKGIREGGARTDDDAMNMAIKRGDVSGADAEALKALIELKSIATRTGLYWAAYPKFLHHRTGKLHPELRQSATNTRRYTGNSPNLQQMESSYGGVRSVILGHHRDAVVVSLDESGQEVRQMADYAKDPTLLTCYLGSADQLRDVHSIVASAIAKCSYDEFRRRLKNGTKEEQDEAAAMRQKAKVVLFASLYGAAAPKIAEGLGIEPDEAQGYIDAIYAQFPKVKEWKDGVEQYAAVNGYVKIHGGTVRHLRDLVLSEDRYIASKAMRQAGNASIQSAGGNQIKRIMSRIWDSDLLDKYDYRWYFSVHDESVHSVGRNDAIEVIKRLHGLMTEQFLDVVPSVSSIGLGRSFGTLVEIGEVFDEDLLKAALDKIFTQ